MPRPTQRQRESESKSEGKYEGRRERAEATRIKLLFTVHPRLVRSPPFFAVTDGSHKWCTRDDIIWWMELLSSSMPTPAADLRFDTLVRACWGIPPAHGSGVSAWQGTNHLDENQWMSVLVTHADGAMSVERVSRQEGDVGVAESGDPLMSEEQAERVRRQLASRGVHAVHVHLLKNNDPRGTAIHANAAIDEPAQNGAVGSKVGAVIEGRDSGRRPSAEEVKIARLGPSGSEHGSHGAGCFGEGEAGLGFDHGMLRWDRVLPSHRCRICHFTLHQEVLKTNSVRGFTPSGLSSTLRHPPLPPALPFSAEL